MVSKAKSIRGSVASIDYILDDKEKGKATILDKNGIVGENGKEIMREFRLMQESNTRCHKNTISIVISPSDERRFTPGQMRKIGREYLRQLGLNNNQYLMTLHTSTGKPHIHIIANRIDANGVAFKDNFISLKGQDIAEKIAKKLGLKTARDIQKVETLLQKEITKPIITEIRSAHNFAVKNSRNFNDYIDLMRGKGIEVKPTINKGGTLQGMKFLHRQSGLEFKSSQIGKDYGLKNLIQKGVKLPTNLTPTLKNIAYQAAKIVIKQASRSAGIGF